MVPMSAVAFKCLVVASSALAMCCTAWYSRFFQSGSDEPNRSDRGRFRRPLALAALLCATSSAAIYVGFLLLWAYSRSHSLNGRQPLGATVICIGLVSAFYAIVGGLFARGLQKFLIVASSVAVAFLWILAGAASAAV
jgi:hypothetical protein